VMSVILRNPIPDELGGKAHAFLGVLLQLNRAPRSVNWLVIGRVPCR